MVDLASFFTPVPDAPTQEDVDEQLAIARLPKRKIKVRDGVFKVIGMPTPSIRFCGHYSMLIQWDDGELDLAYQCRHCSHVLIEEYFEWHQRTEHNG